MSFLLLDVNKWMDGGMIVGRQATSSSTCSSFISIGFLPPPPHPVLSAAVGTVQFEERCAQRAANKVQPCWAVWVEWATAELCCRERLAHLLLLLMHLPPICCHLARR